MKNSHTHRAYSRSRFDVLAFCHKNRFADLTLNTMCLDSSSQQPLMIDALQTEKFSLLRKVLQCSPVVDPTTCAQQLVTRTYEWGSRKDTLLSFACRAHNTGRQTLLPTLLSTSTLSCHLSHIKIEGVGLNSVPLALFSHRLSHLDLSGNRLTTLPLADAHDQGLCDGLVEVAIASNDFTELPPELFRLPKLVKLNAKDNQIVSLTEAMWTAPCLEELFLGKNKIESLPCPDYVLLAPGMVTASAQRRIMTFSHGLPSLGNSEARCVESARQSFMTLAAHGTTDSQSRGFRLKTLDLSDNQLSEITPGLPCLAPQLRTLKLSGNRINHMGHPCNYPQLLEKLDMNRNGCKSCIHWCAEPPSLVCAQSRLRHEYNSCLHIGHNVLGHLKFLFLDDNSLQSVSLEEEWTVPRLDSSGSSSPCWGPKSGVGDSGRQRAATRGESKPLQLMFPRLESLRLSNNQLQSVPANIHRQTELRELKLDRNPGITYLPSNLHLLQELFFFSFEGVSDPVVSELRSCRNTPEQLLYLKAREKE